MTEWAGLITFLPAAITWFARPSLECVCRVESDQKLLGILERQLERCGPENLHPTCQCNSAWIFVVGAIRAGSTLLEQMLDLHPAIVGLDEVV